MLPGENLRKTRIPQELKAPTPSHFHPFQRSAVNSSWPWRLGIEESEVGSETQWTGGTWARGKVFWLSSFYKQCVQRASLTASRFLAYFLEPIFSFVKPEQ